jgi:hypothetical protein
MTQCENGKVGIPIADHTTADELAALYSTVGLNGDCRYRHIGKYHRCDLWRPATIRHSRAQLAPERLAAVHIQDMDVNKTEFGGTVQAGQRFETLAARARAAR